MEDTEYSSESRSLGFPLTSLPSELLLYLLGFCDGRSLVRLRQTRRALNETISSNPARLRTISDLQLHVIFSVRDNRFVSCNTNSDDISAIPEIPEHAFQDFKIRRCTFFWAKFLYRRSKIIVIKPKTKHCLRLHPTRLFRFLFRHATASSVVTNLQEKGLRRLNELLPVNVCRFEYRRRTTQKLVWEPRLLRLLTKRPLITSLKLNLRRSVSVNFYAHPSVQRLQEFVWTNVTYAPNELVTDEALLKQRWIRATAGRTTVTEEGLRELVKGWIESKREIEELRFAFAKNEYRPSIDEIIFELEHVQVCDMGWFKLLTRADAKMLKLEYVRCHANDTLVFSSFSMQ